RPGAGTSCDHSSMLLRRVVDWARPAPVAGRAPPPPLRNPLRGDPVPSSVTRPRRQSVMLGYLIDMDGVIYRGSHLIPGADRFIRSLRAADVPFLFLTNNSQRTRRDVATKLQRLGFDAGEEHVFTCAMATARFLAQQKPQGTAYVIGEGGLL